MHHWIALRGILQETLSSWWENHSVLYSLPSVSLQYTVLNCVNVLKAHVLSSMWRIAKNLENGLTRYEVNKRINSIHIHTYTHIYISNI